MASVKNPSKTGNFEAAQRRGVAEMKLGAESVRYDRRRGAVVLKMRSGAEALIPRALIPVINEVDSGRIGRLELSPMGTTLSFPDLDADFSIQGLIRRAFEVNEANRLAGATKSPARAAASRTNGRKGGRPAKKTAAHRAKT